MYEITIQSKSKIIVGKFTEQLKKKLVNQDVIIVTDKNINRLYAQQFPQFPVVTIGTGESVKTLQTVEYIAEQLLNLGADRHTFLLAIGGGLVCDMVGFVASVYMRGIDFGFVSTSLLSQIDASVGGKNGVNFKAYKNILGNFNQPKFVICDTKMLQTLPPSEWLSGLGELLKHSLIADKHMFEMLHQKGANIINTKENFWSEMVFRNIQIKAAVVEKDEREQGERKKLNLGHTLAHAIENQKNITHGSAVALGLIFSAKVSHQKGYLSSLELKKITDTIQQLGFDTQIVLDKKLLKQAITKDKKKQASEIDFVMIYSIGNVHVERVRLEEINKWIDDLC